MACAAPADETTSTTTFGLAAAPPALATTCLFGTAAAYASIGTEPGTKSEATKPAMAIMARRPFLSSRSL